MDLSLYLYTLGYSVEKHCFPIFHVTEATHPHCIIVVMIIIHVKDIYCIIIDKSHNHDHGYDHLPCPMSKEILATARSLDTSWPGRGPSGRFANV